MHLFLQPIFHLVWSVNSVGSGVTLRACGLLLETRRVLTHTVLFQNLFIFFSVFEIRFCMFRACCFFLEFSRILTNRRSRVAWKSLGFGFSRFQRQMKDERCQIKKVRLSPQLRSNSVKGSVSGR